MKKPIRIMDTIFRDASQSKIATRMRIEDMLPIAAKLDKVGYHSVEMWGGATFDSCIRYLNEDPWERIRALKKAMPNTRMQMVIRGQSLVGYRHYPDDVVIRFVEKAAENGIDIFRAFDALDDIRNLKTVIQTVKRLGKIAEGTVCYTVSPVHTIDLILRKARELEDLGIDSFCLKDMAGLLSPYTTYEIIRRLKESMSVPIHLHTHDTCGMGAMTCLKAIEAGADIIDTVLSPFSEGTGQPPTESLVLTLKDTPYDTGLDLRLLADIADDAREMKKKYKEYETDLGGVDSKIMVTQIPGGVMSNMVAQLKQAKALHRLDEILQEIPRVRKDLGYISLVTPTSQVIVVQATVNVITGERYKVITNETRELLRGGYGETPGPVDRDLQKKALTGEPPIACRPGDLIPNAMGRLRKELEEVTNSEEDILTYALFPHVAIEFFKKRRSTG
ncbi:MAG: pyruvate carboxylase subunit B [Deltaproteobacteria bacterium]|nr:MAG: pyruvate carboxylase subunit B [Deltaproteobacteria bacterium]